MLGLAPLGTLPVGVGAGIYFNLGQARVLGLIGWWPPAWIGGAAGSSEYRHVTPIGRKTVENVKRFSSSALKVAYWCRTIRVMRPELLPASNVSV